MNHLDCAHLIPIEVAEPLKDSGYDLLADKLAIAGNFDDQALGGPLRLQCGGFQLGVAHGSGGTQVASRPLRARAMSFPSSVSEGGLIFADRAEML